MKVALGFKAHSGWAVVVVVGCQGGSAPRVLERGRVELVLPDQRPWGKAPYHAAETLAPDAAHALVQRAAAVAAHDHDDGPAGMGLEPEHDLHGSLRIITNLAMPGA